jgi:hypothetical protein
MENQYEAAWEECRLTPFRGSERRHRPFYSNRSFHLAGRKSMTFGRQGVYAAAVIALAGLHGCGRAGNEGTFVGTGVYHAAARQVAANSPPANTAAPAGGANAASLPTAPPMGNLPPAVETPPPATGAPPSTGGVGQGSNSGTDLPPANSPPASNDDQAAAAAAMLSPGGVPPAGTAPGPSSPSVDPSLSPAPPSTPDGLSPAAADGAASASGPGSRLAAVTNQWRAGNTKLIGVTRMDEKTVVTGYSWMTQLLPHLGHDDVYRKFDFAKEWHIAPNLEHTGNVIPDFLDPANPHQHMKSFRFVDQRGPALTHFVGMSGIEDHRNLVAATLPRSDPRAGIFGYNQVARPAEVTDGTSHTIMLIGSGRVMGPWVEGGGATIRGAREPYFDEISGFGSASMNGGGAISMMADGSVRRISKDIDPAVFRSLCTMHGAEAIDLKALDAAPGGK